MSRLIEEKEGFPAVLMGNEAIARGALEAGIDVAAGYPGTPSSEIVENLAKVAKERNLYVEWSTNEKISLEVAAAASFCQSPGHMRHEAERSERSLRLSPAFGRIGNPGRFGVGGLRRSRRPLQRQRRGI